MIQYSQQKSKCGRKTGAASVIVHALCKPASNIVCAGRGQEAR